MLHFTLERFLKIYLKVVLKRKLSDVKLSNVILKSTFRRKRLKFGGITTEVKIRLMAFIIFL